MAVSRALIFTNLNIEKKSRLSRASPNKPNIKPLSPIISSSTTKDRQRQAAQ